MKSPVVKAILLVAALSLVLMVGAIVGGSFVYAISHLDGLLPTAQAQGTDFESGIVVASVEPEGPAAEAGVVRGDILLEIDGQAVDNRSALTRRLAALDPGAEIVMTLLHGDDKRTLTATTGEEHGRAYLGLAICMAEPERVVLGAMGEGPVIIEVIPGGPADKAGMQDGEVITAVDGQPLGEERELAGIVAEHRPGDMIVLRVARPGMDPREVEVKLGEHPDQEGMAYLGVRYASTLYGDSLRERPQAFRWFRELDPGDLPYEHLEEFGFDEMPFLLPHDGVITGAIVREVVEDSPASEAGLEPGDVITAIDGEPVETPEALMEAIEGRQPGEGIMLTVMRADSGEEEALEAALAESPDAEGKAYLGVYIGGSMRIETYRDEGGPESPAPDREERPFGLPPEIWPPHGFPWDHLPFDPGDLLFDWKGFEQEFDFGWPPGEDGCDGSPGCLEESA